MNKSCIFFALIIVITMPVDAWFARDKAAVYAQKSEWTQSRMQLQPLLVENPHDAQLLYDSGVAAYKMSEFDQAHAYFSQAAEHAVDNNLKEKAYFNCGNTCVQQKQLHEALDAYDEALKINPDNERTKHNRDIVQKMLDDQKQQEQQNNEQQQQQEENKEQDKKDNKQDQNQQGQDQQGDDSSRQDDSHADDQNGSDNDQQHNDRNADQGEEQEQKGQEGEQQDQSDKDDRSQNNTGKDSGNEPQQKDSTNERGSDGTDHEQTPDEQAQGNGSSSDEDMQEEEKEQEGVGPQDAAKDLDMRLARILDRQEQHDADLNKQVIKMQVDKELAGQHGQNRW